MINGPLSKENVQKIELDFQDIYADSQSTFRSFGLIIIEFIEYLNFMET